MEGVQAAKSQRLLHQEVPLARHKALNFERTMPIPSILPGALHLTPGPQCQIPALAKICPILLPALLQVSLLFSKGHRDFPNCFQMYLRAQGKGKIIPSLSIKSLWFQGPNFTPCINPGQSS
jgi:hypothetical protein